MIATLEAMLIICEGSDGSVYDSSVRESCDGPNQQAPHNAWHGHPIGDKLLCRHLVQSLWIFP